MKKMINGVSIEMTADEVERFLEEQAEREREREQGDLPAEDILEALEEIL